MHRRQHYFVLYSPPACEQIRAQQPFLRRGDFPTLFEWKSKWPTLAGPPGVFANAPWSLVLCVGRCISASALLSEEKPIREHSRMRTRYAHVRSEIWKAMGKRVFAVPKRPLPTSWLRIWRACAAGGQSAGPSRLIDGRRRAIMEGTCGRLGKEANALGIIAATTAISEMTCRSQIPIAKIRVTQMGTYAGEKDACYLLAFSP
ncbi:hypothetical protein BJ912DRAFT_928320 [Pholiota molesta]|nr:hypothetical protein BJ912DRAFT_928320 [Pholiota molesta]